jgi:hypothetical protein
LGDIIANDLLRGPVIVDIAPGDAGFNSRDCGTWSIYAPSTITTSFGDGVWSVGGRIPAGRYQGAGGPSCYWERKSGFSGTLGDILANDFGSAPIILDVLPTDAGVKTQNCGTFSLVS